MSPDPEYDRILAELTADQRLRLLDKDFDLQRELSKKSEQRRKLAKLSPAEKLRLLQELRNRAQLQHGSRRSEAKTLPPRQVPKRLTNRFGGRATAAGLNYEVNIAAFIAVKMLCGSKCSIWDDITGADVTAIAMQSSDFVDDIVVSLRSDPEARVFISAKQRSGTIALTSRSPAFVDTVNAFVRQYLKLSANARLKSRFVWAVPSCVGQTVTHSLPEALFNHRRTGDTSLSEFLSERNSGERRALEALLSVVSKQWKNEMGTPPTDVELRCFLCQVYVQVYDFGAAKGQQREAEENIRFHVVTDTKQAHRAWQIIQSVFVNANQSGIRVVESSLREALVKDGVALKSPPDYAAEIAYLNELTARNLARVREHSILRFGSETADVVHISRTEELSALRKAAKLGHLLITGEPGCGKSGLIYDFVDSLRRDGVPIVLLLAEDVFSRDWKGSANIPGFTHAIDEVLANWANGARGLLITDALDAVRDIEAQKLLRRLLRDVQEGQCGWSVVASVREFDLKYGRELREQFSGVGVEGYASNDFAGVAHFHLSGLSEAQLDELALRRVEIQPFIQSARSNTKAGGVHRSPFYLQLAAELLRNGVPSSRLADWNSPAVLLRRFWEIRVTEGAGVDDRKVALKAICRRMVDTRSMAVSSKELELAVCESSLNDLRSRGILQAPVLRHGTNVGSDEIRFTHHLLHDYAVARSLIPETLMPFCDFVASDALLPILYRQSFLFALEEIWDASDERSGFWQCALELERVPTLHGVTRILGPVLAARRVESLIDLQPLLTAVSQSNDINSPSQKALRHLASGLQDANPDAIRAGASGWCAFAEQLAILLELSSSFEQPLTLIIAHLIAVNAATEFSQRFSLNAAARRLLSRHVTKEYARGWRYASQVATDTLCKTFAVAPLETQQALLSLLTPERLKQFPHHDLFDLSHSIKHLSVEGDTVVIRLFEAAYAAEPEGDQWEPDNSAILSLRFQTRDSWNIIRYSLAEYYEARTDNNAAFMTEAMCIAWNSVVRRRVGVRSREEPILATIQFRGRNCELIQDSSHVWGREFEHDENRMLKHFEELLRKWAQAGDSDRLNTALDRFAVKNQTALMWTVFLEIGGEYPSTLGVLLREVLDESLFLFHPDYIYGGTALLGGLHKVGDAALRERLEKLILDLPNNVRSQNEVKDALAHAWGERAQNRVLGALEESNIVLAAVRNLWRERKAANALTSNPKPKAPEAKWSASEESAVELSDPADREMLRLREALTPLRNNKGVNLSDIEKLWPVIEECERTWKLFSTRKSEIAQELWGHLVGACENVVRYTRWPKTDPRWRVIRRILLEAAYDPVPDAKGDEAGDQWPSWGWPSPRVDAAQGLPLLAFHLGKADRDVSKALRALCTDKSLSVRFNLAFRVGALSDSAPTLMWEMIDKMVAYEPSSSVLDALLRSIDPLWAKFPDELLPRLKIIAERAGRASPENSIHEMLAHTNLFQFLRTGQVECESYIAELIAHCDSDRASKALLAQLHSLRVGGWLTAGDPLKADSRADAIRSRTWGFLFRLVESAHEKLSQHYEAWKLLSSTTDPNAEESKACRERMERSARLIDGVAMQLYFASGAHAEQAKLPAEDLSPAQARRFWNEAKPLFTKLAEEPHPHTAYQFVQTLYHLLPYAPRDAFLLAAQSIRKSSTVGFQYEPLAVAEVVKLIQRALADHRDIFRSRSGQESECLVALLEVLDLFVEVGWSEARQLTHRLEEIYR